MSHFKIALINCYFGKLPWYFPFFLKSCGYNHNIKFYLFTDNPPNISLPENLEIIYTTLFEVESWARCKIDINVNISYPYKLCDFKPAYGVIFEDFLSGFDFWGHGDLDVVYGNTRLFLTDDILNCYDIISLREEYLTGYFTLYKNSPEINRLYEKSKDYKMVFSDQKHFCFDECNFMFSHLRNSNSIENVHSEIESMTHVVKKFSKMGLINAYFDLHAIDDTPGSIEWNCGQLSYKDKYEIMIYHFLKFKKQFILDIPSWDEIPDHFFIEPFYISKYSPTSLIGRIQKHFLQIKRKIGLFLAYQIRVLASKKEKVNSQDLAGNYIFLYDKNTSIIIETSRNKLLISYSNICFSELLHYKDNVFLHVKNKSIISFIYDSEQHQSVLRVTDYQGYQMDFIKQIAT